MLLTDLLDPASFMSTLYLYGSHFNVLKFKTIFSDIIQSMETIIRELFISVVIYKLTWNEIFTELSIFKQNTLCVWVQAHCGNVPLYSQPNEHLCQPLKF